MELVLGGVCQCGVWRLAGWLTEGPRTRPRRGRAHTHTHTQAVVETQLIKHTHIKADKQKAQPPHSVVDMCLSRVSAHHPLTPPWWCHNRNHWCSISYTTGLITHTQWKLMPLVSVRCGLPSVEHAAVNLHVEQRLFCCGAFGWDADAQRKLDFAAILWLH